MRVLLDTNLLTRLINEVNQEFYRPAVASVEQLRNAGHTLCLVPQNVYEFWSVATRPVESNGLGMSPEAARQEVDEFLPLFHLLRDERSIFAKWLELVTSVGVSGRPSHDARLVAAMLRHDVTHILSFNEADFRRFTEVTAVNPTALLDGSASVG